ncbi:MAG: Slam-dependent surface lipoprotein [Sphingobium sp.]|uniref:Slam-dependent surface lipoprotein n=1 Tax=Sphingobium sp. TaxID=1912891 RepID=UPI0029BBA884|nr:Slam-dependent surface lipoprotein [Sphingobium sp.]MDX3911278.1 Slam-dependent surface lipoprotein [Sphingobium sp.]
MKFVHLKAFVGTMALSVALAGTAQAQLVSADITSGVSKPTLVDIDVSTVNANPVHVPGRVGISVPSTNGQYIDFQGLKNILGNNTVTTFINTTEAETDHSQYGRFDFGQAGSNDVWFGEWSQAGDASGSSHTVYFGGSDATTNVEALLQSGEVKYAVNGIGNYATNGLLSGEFTANFDGLGGGSISGDVTNGSYTVDIGTATITNATFSGNGGSVASGAGTLASSGAVTGQFYGSNVDALAGYVTFTNTVYDTAFGGTRTTP